MIILNIPLKIEIIFGPFQKYICDSVVKVAITWASLGCDLWVAALAALVFTAQDGPGTLAIVSSDTKACIQPPAETAIRAA